MGVTTLIVGGAALVGGGIAQADYARKSANQQADLAKQQAEQTRLRAEREVEIAKEQKETEIRLASERMEFEKQSRKEKTEFVTGQMEKQAAEVRAAAIAGYAASGIEIEGRSSSETVLKRIETESKAQEAEVKREYKEFVSARELEFKQLQETEELGYEWFTSRLHQETQWDVQNRLAEAAAYRSKGKYGQMSAGFNIMSGVASTYGAGVNYGYWD